jgi:hypothetical protein
MVTVMITVFSSYNQGILRVMFSKYVRDNFCAHMRTYHGVSPQHNTRVLRKDAHA